VKAIVTIAIILVAAFAFADDVTLEWDANTEPYLSGYKIHWGSTSGNYTSSLDVGKVTTVTIPNIEPGTIFAATAYATDKTSYMIDCMADPVMIEAYPDETARNTKCSDDFGTGMESSYSNEVVYEGDGTIVMLAPTELTVFKPGNRIEEGLEIFYDFKGTGSIIEDKSIGDAAINLVIESGTVDRIAGGGIQVVNSSAIKSLNPPLQLLNKLKATNSITVEAWVKPLFANQTGPARIVTFSQDPYFRNFTLGQQNDQYVLRLRRSASTLNGMPELLTPAGSLQEDGLTHVVATYGEGVAKIYINGEQLSSANWEGSLADWDDSMNLALANEFVSERTWLGAIYLVAIYSKVLSASEVIANYQAGF
jgi:hypothetical protein